MSWLEYLEESKNPTRDAIQGRYADTMAYIEHLKSAILSDEKRVAGRKAELAARSAEAQKLADWLRNNP